MKTIKVQWTKRKIILTLCGAAVVLIVGTVTVFLKNHSSEKITYKETTVNYGDLVVGVTESGAVDIGTVEQTFDLDMSALQRADTGSSEGNTASNSGDSPFGSAGGQGQSMNMFSQILGMAEGNHTNQSGEDSTLTVAQVCVSVGQQVAEGDALYELEEDSVTELQEELEANVQKAEADLEAVYADQTLSRQTAQYTYDSSIAYGEYAATEYQTTIQELQDAVTDAQTTLTRAQELLDNYKEKLASVTQSYEDAAQVLANCEYSVEQTEQEDVYSYVYYFQLMQQAQTNYDSLEQQKEQLEKNVEQAEQNVTTAQTAYDTAERNLEQGKLTAQETLDLRKLAYNTAQETYDVAIAYLEQDAKEQEQVYQETQEKWEEFTSYIDGNAVRAKNNGVITSVNLEAGDTIQTGSSLVTLYDMDDVTMTVTVDEADMTDIVKGSAANITFTAYPDSVFTATVTELGDAQTDANGNVTYDVTVTLDGDISGLFQGMTGELTFVTEEKKAVLYVLKRAVTVENEKAYVKVRDEKGNIQTKEVVTGFTDGINVEIQEGLSEGDVVLIESRVSSS